MFLTKLFCEYLELVYSVPRYTWYCARYLLGEYVQLEPIARKDFCQSTWGFMPSA